MQTALVEVGVGDQLPERGEVGAPESRETLHELIQRHPSIPLEHGETLEAVEWPRGTVLQDSSSADHPVRLLPGDEVADDVARAPAVGGVGCVGPGLRQTDEQRAQ